jgi:general stress protein YciG
MDRDNKGQFTAGNSIASQGGKARARTLSPERRSEIAKKGFQAMVDKHYGGDRSKATAMLIARGLWALDKDYAPNLRIRTNPDAE